MSTAVLVHNHIIVSYIHVNKTAGDKSQLSTITAAHVNEEV